MHSSLFSFAQALLLRNRSKELETELSFVTEQKADEEVSGQSSFSLLVAKISKGPA